jgi:hypothetical protein
MNIKITLLLVLTLSFNLPASAQATVDPATESFGRMQRNIGRIFGMATTNSVIVAHCVHSQNHGTFFRSYWSKLDEEVAPPLVMLKKLNSRLVQEKFGTDLDLRLEKVLQAQMSSLRADTERKLAKLPSLRESDEMCASHKAHVKNGLFDLEPFVSLYLADLKNLDPREHETASRYSAALKNAESALRDLAAK